MKLKVNQKKEKTPKKEGKKNPSKQRTRHDVLASETAVSEEDKPEFLNEEHLLSTVKLEPAEEVQFTETSYTSASLETIASPVVVEVKSKRRKKKKVQDDTVHIQKSDIIDHSLWSGDSEMEVEVSQPTVEVSIQTKGKPKGKGKKAKRNKKEKEKKEGDKPDFEKPKKWKKMNLKERAEWLAARTEQWKAEVEADKQAKLAGAEDKKLRLENERNQLMEREKREHEVRRDILLKVCNMFQKYENLKAEEEMARLDKVEWRQYMRCDGLPDALKVQELNYYLSTWKEHLICSDNELSKKYEDIFPMLEIIDVFTLNSRKCAAEQKVLFDEVRLALLDQIRLAIQCTCFQLLLNVEKNLDFKPVTLAMYHRTYKNLHLHLWVAVKLPTSRKLIKEEKVLTESPVLTFPDIGLELSLPTSINTTNITLMIAHSEIDLFSEKTRTYALHDEMPNKFEDLLTFNIREFTAIEDLRRTYDETRKKFYADVNKRTRELEKIIRSNPYLKFESEKEELEKLSLAEPPPMLGDQDPRERIVVDSENAFIHFLKSCNIKMKTGEINLRKYRICGGVLFINPIETPKQTKFMASDIVLSTFELPRVLKILPYEVRYRAPAAPNNDKRSKLEMQADLEKVQEEYEKLVLVNIQLPRDVFWVKSPTVCQWCEAKQRWMTNYITDFYCDELNESIRFRTGILWPVGVATLRFSNLPFKHWSVGPEENGSGVIVSVTSVQMTLTFLCRGRNVVLKAAESAKSDFFNRLIDKQMTIRSMLKALREAGCDIFPDFDSYNYVEGCSPKEWPMERHNYHAMAFLSRAYNFQRSQWNKQAGYRTIVVQMKEAVDRRVRRYQLLHVTPQRATILKNNENMDNYSDEQASDIPFQPDLFTLNLYYGSTEAKKIAFKMNHTLTETVFDFLTELKLCSFSQ